MTKASGSPQRAIVPDLAMHQNQPPLRQLAWELVQRHGWNSTAHQILNPGIRHSLSARGDAVTGYVDHGRVRVAAGVPVCAPERLIDVMAELEGAAARDGRRVCYFYAEERIRVLLAERGGYAVVQIGAQPVWDPTRWAAAFDGHASLRAQRHRARNKGVAVVEWARAAATRHPGLQRCLAEWTRSRPMTPLHFLVEPDTLGFLDGRRVFVAEKAGRPIGFLLASPVPLRRGWLIEQIIRGDGAPNGTSETLVDAAVRAMAADGDRFVTLGLAALAPREPRVANPRWLRLLFAWARSHGRRFYNFDGLERFKAKFHPQGWEPVHMIARERRFSAGSLLAVAGAFTGGKVGAAACGTLRRALRQELQWLAGADGCKK